MSDVRDDHDDMTTDEAIARAGYRAWAAKTGIKPTFDQQPDAVRDAWIAAIRHKDTPVFISIDLCPAKPNTHVRGVNLRHLEKVMWEATGDGRDAAIRLEVKGMTDAMFIPVGHPDAGRIARAVGLGARFAEWPREKAKAEQAYRERQAAEKAEAERVRLERQLSRARSLGLGELFPPDILKHQ